MHFHNKLIFWYLKNKRDLPWRRSVNIYHIWISEIILQQTQVKQGLKYYERFIRTFPTIFDLARSDEESILKLWQGLGYYTRARNLHYTANYIVDNFNGNFPETYKDLIKLKGIGDYTASAIASICFDEPTAVVDGNVFRVLSRYFGLDIPINSSKGKIYSKDLAQKLIDKKRPGTFNEALMEFGALLCKPKNPECSSCPFNNNCLGLKSGMVEKYPVKINKIKIKKRFFNYVVLSDNHNKIQIIKRQNNEIWKNLYEFPLIESSREINLEKLITLEKFKSITKEVPYSISLFNENKIVHKLTHQHIYTKFWLVKVYIDNKHGISWDEFENYPVPTLIQNFITDFNRTPKPLA
jgi:A/G-specific adenine glycosylase